MALDNEGAVSNRFASAMPPYSMMSPSTPGRNCLGQEPLTDSANAARDNNLTAQIFVYPECDASGQCPLDRTTNFSDENGPGVVISVARGHLLPFQKANGRFPSSRSIHPFWYYANCTLSAMVGGATACVLHQHLWTLWRSAISGFAVTQLLCLMGYATVDWRRMLRDFFSVGVLTEGSGPLSFLLRVLVGSLEGRVAFAGGAACGLLVLRCKGCVR
ncbi:hypothetical protein ERJ75_000732000 [Trypanosoma vivax]|nr:hypothetical protein TRVL_00629 [Trypanosoma vivax]KAH8613978.1 hypothetical protein ERJ75_000732000 [Trypanosoma vivax]